MRLKNINTPSDSDGGGGGGGSGPWICRLRYDDTRMYLIIGTRASYINRLTHVYKPHRGT